MRLKVMTPIYRGKRTVDLDFVDFCQFQNVFKGEGRFFKVFPELWDFALTTSDLITSTTWRGERESVSRKFLPVALEVTFDFCQKQ